MAARGRPKSFDREAALEKAMLVFWDRGFEATGVDDLAGTMGISTSSLYATFGGKEDLFLAALDYYQGERGSYTKSAMENGSTARDCFRNLFEASAIELTRTDQPRGCMLALALPTCSPEMEPLRLKMNERRGVSLRRFVERLRRAVREGEIDSSCDTSSLALFFLTTIQGMSIQARTGASREKLLTVGKLAMRVWPENIAGGSV